MSQTTNPFGNEPRRVSGYPGGHTGLLVVALATHAVVGYTLGRVVFGRPWTGLVGGVVADVDLLVPAWVGPPLAHRGVTHTPVAALLAVAAAYLLTRDWRVAGAVGLGYASQLLIDLTTAQGIPVAYPLSGSHVAVPLGTHAGTGTALLWLGCVALLWGQPWSNRVPVDPMTRLR